MIVISPLGGPPPFLAPQCNSTTLSFNAPLGRLQNSHHAQSRFATRERFLAFTNAFGEVADELREGLDLRNVGRPDVARAVADENAAPSFGVAVDGDAAIVDFEFLGRIEIVVDDAACGYRR